MEVLHISNLLPWKNVSAAVGWMTTVIKQYTVGYGNGVT